MDILAFRTSTNSFDEIKMKTTHNYYTCVAASLPQVTTTARAPDTFNGIVFWLLRDLRPFSPVSGLLAILIAQCAAAGIARSCTYEYR